MNTSRFTIVVMSASLLFALAACQRNEGPAERLGKQVDSAAQKAGEQVEKAGDKLKDTADEAKKKLSN